jgi:hypothetical protein
VCGHWQKLHPNIGVRKVEVHTHFFIRSELRLLTVFFVQNLLFRVAEINKSIVKLTFRDSTVILDLIISQSLILIE